MKHCLLLMLALGACSTGAPRTPDQVACERQANDDPTVSLLLIKGAGSEHFALEHQEDLRAARQTATVACLQSRGVIRRGGVERQRPLDK